MAKSESSEAINADTGAPAAAPKNKRGVKRGADGANARPRNCLLLRDFLIPRLDEGLYGEDLEWIDRKEGVFRIGWTHQGKKSFDRVGPSVFRDWSILKDNWDDDKPNGLAMAKQRLRAAFRKLPNLRRIHEDTASHRVYRIDDIESYLEPGENNENKRKKQRQCACGTGCDECMPEHLRQQSSDSTSSDEDIGEPYDGNGRGNAGSGSDSDDSRTLSVPSPTVASIVLSTMHCLMESSSEPPTPPPAMTSESPPPPPPPSEPEEQGEAYNPFIGRSSDEIEAAKALLMLRYGPLEGLCDIPATPPPPPQPAQPTLGLLATRGQVTVGTSAPPSTARQKDQVVPAQAASSSPERSLDEGSSSPESVRAFEKQAAPAVDTAAHSTEDYIVTGDSPLAFLAYAAPAQREAELASGGVDDVGDMMSSCSQTPKVSE